MKTLISKTLFLTALISAFLYLNACAMVFNGGKNKIDVDSHPRRADVYINGHYVGKTPVKLKLNVRKDYTVTFKKKGYDPISYKIDKSVNAGWVILDVFFGMPWGLVIDWSTGAWKSLKDVNVHLFKSKSH